MGAHCLECASRFGFQQDADHADDTQTKSLSRMSPLFFVQQNQVCAKLKGQSNRLGLYSLPGQRVPPAFSSSHTPRAMYTWP